MPPSRGPRFSIVVGSLLTSGGYLLLSTTNALWQWYLFNDLLSVFMQNTRQAIQRGLLQGYRREDVALNTVRGRIRFGDQIGHHFDIPLPVEVSFDEFTEDIEKNRLLKTAIHRQGWRSAASGPPLQWSSSAHTGAGRCPESATSGWTSTTATPWNWRVSS